MKIPGADPKMLDDLARVAGGAVNIVSGLQEQIMNDVRTRMEEMATKLDLVPRDELEQAKGMITKLRTQVQALEVRVGLLESGHKKAPAKKNVRAVVGSVSGKAKAKPAVRKKNKSKPIK